MLICKIYAKSCRKNSRIDQQLYQKFHINRGLRRSDGTGVLAGITNICNVHGYVVNEGEVEAIPGELIYRGYDIYDLVHNAQKKTATAMKKLLIYYYSANCLQKTS